MEYGFITFEVCFLKSMLQCDVTSMHPPPLLHFFLRFVYTFFSYSYSLLRYLIIYICTRIRFSQKREEVCLVFWVFFE